MRHIFYLYYLCLLLIPRLGIAQGCVVDTEVIIQPFITTDIVLTIDNLLNEDLGQDQAICGLQLVFEHDQLENIRITLTSPDGDEVILIGPGITTGALTDLILWNISFAQCANPAAPDVGFNALWDNNQNWQSFQTYTGIYHPFQNCLEGFDSGSANGNWILSIENLGPAIGTLFYFEIILCNDSGNDCSSCFLHVGDFDDEFEIFCEDDVRLEDISDLLEINYITDNTQLFQYVLSHEDSILSISESMSDLIDLDPGIYEICGLVYASEDSLEVHSTELYEDLNMIIDDRLVCADLSENCLTLDILETNEEVFIDTVFCTGDTLMIRNIPIFRSIDTLITVFDTISNQPFTIACDSIIRIVVQEHEVNSVINATTTNVICNQAIFLNGSSSNSNPAPIVSFLWTTTDGNFVNNNGPIAEIDAAGEYQLKVANGICEDSISILIDGENSFISTLSEIPILCSYDTMSVEIFSNVLMDSIQITGPEIIDQSISLFSTTLEGNYEIISFFGSCSNVNTIDLMNEATEIEIEVSSTMIDCSNMISIVSVVTNASNPQIEYSGPEIISDNNFNPEILTSGMYRLSITDEFGCRAIDSFEIINNSLPPNITIQDLSRSCNDPAVTLPLSVDMPIDSVIWLGPDGFISNEINPSALIEGQYNIEVFADNGCSNSDSLMLLVSNENVIFGILGANLDCINAEVELCLDFTDDTDSLVWTNNNQLIANTECISVEEIGEYSLQVFDENGCFGMNSFFVDDLATSFNIQLDASSNQLDCNTSSVTLVSTPEVMSQDYEFSWIFNGNEISTNSTIEIDNPGTYIIQIQDTISQCIERDSIDIVAIENSLSDILVSTVDPLCFGENGELQFSNLPQSGINDLFLNNTAFELASTLQNMSPGSYDVEIINEEGCIFDTTVIINEGNIVDVDLGVDLFALLGEQVDLNVNLNLPLDQLSLFNWSHPELLSCQDCLDPSILVNGNTIISLEIADFNGCNAVDELSILVDNNIEIFVPNIFTPDGDGNNAILTLFISNQIIKIFDIRILDRWGNLLFFHPEITKEANNFSWDGTFDGEDLGSGVYVFMAKLLLIDNSETIIVEDITLLR